MTRFNSHRFALAAALTLSLIVLFSTSTVAQATKMEGIIKARNGDTLILQTSSSPNVAFC